MNAPQFRTVRARQAVEHQQMSPHFGAYGLRSTESFSIDPFVNLDDFMMSQPTFPPHPHAGFSAVTYLFEDSGGAFINRDSLGDISRIEPGAMHWTQAAHGMMHEEVPEVPGQACHGLQMFVNLKEAHKGAKPAAFHLSAADIPELRPDNGIRIRVLAGTLNGAASPLTELLTPVTFLDVHLAPNAVVELPAPRQHTAFVFVVDGAGRVDQTEVTAHAAVLLASDGDLVRVVAGPEGMHLLFGEGAPIGEPVVFGGPFLMTRAEDIFAAKQRFTRGEMGRLEPLLR